MRLILFFQNAKMPSFMDLQKLGVLALLINIYFVLDVFICILTERIDRID